VSDSPPYLSASRNRRWHKSGFLITWILLTELDKTGTINTKRFYSRRFLRLSPAYASMLTGMFIGAAILEPTALARVLRVLPAIVTYTYNDKSLFTHLVSRRAA
jgi:peptidoglycan/LPS O-acetylase OafA/YrhL